jgi:thiol-disulfide isomerase/thioredoxin
MPQNRFSRRSLRDRQLGILLFAVVAFGLITANATMTAQTTPAPQDPTAFLKWSMSHYQALGSFQAQCAWSMDPGATATRTIVYSKPNQYKVVSDNHRGFVMTAVCDGQKAVEYTNQAGMGAQSYPAPISLATVKTMEMQHPMFCGTLLYLFFGGPTQLTKLVNTSKSPLRFGPAVTLNGQSCKTVRLYATGTYGTMEVAISTQDGLVRRIRYGNEPLLAMVRSATAQQPTQKAKPGQKKTPSQVPAQLETTELYTNIQVGTPIAATVFDTKLPQGTQATQMPGGNQSDDSKPPVPLGQPAPNFEVTALSGKKVKLSDFRGKVVMLDFWATWCPPCRKSLPETQKIEHRFVDKGLIVMAISDEDAPTVKPFLNHNHYTFSTYLDPKDQANKAFNIQAIPTVAIVDRGGHLVTYLVGLQDSGTILSELHKAGLQTQ